jgi:hypothetical protein
MIKRRFARTNKRNYVYQLAAAELRERFMRRIAQRLKVRTRLSQVKASQTRRHNRAHTNTIETDAVGSFATTSTRYDIGNTTRYWVNIVEWVHTNRDDVAIKDFISRLKDHIITRLCGKEYDGDEQEYSHAEQNMLLIQDNRLYFHSTLRVNYTSYDLRRQQDVINPSSHPDVMVLSREDGENVHPYWYARVIKICHLLVSQSSSDNQGERTRTEPQRVDVLWVRWFGLDTDARGGWSKKRLHGISFIPWDEPGAFGFLDPAQVIRGVHLIPNFPRGQTDARLPHSIARPAEDEHKDWDSYYINV